MSLHIVNKFPAKYLLILNPISTDLNSQNSQLVHLCQNPVGTSLNHMYNHKATNAQLTGKL